MTATFVLPLNVALVADQENIPVIHETYPGNIHDSIEFPTLIDGIVNRLTNLKINTEDLILVFDKGNNSEKNIDKLISKMSFVASAKSEQAETLMDISLDEFKYLYTNSKQDVTLKFPSWKKLNILIISCR